MGMKKNIQTTVIDGLKRRLTGAEKIGLAMTVHPFLADTVKLHSMIGHNDDAAKLAADAKRARKAARNLRNAR